jgi:hypothetical protein
MKPDNFNKKQRQSVARVKTIIKGKLAWMTGFPVSEHKQLVWRYGLGAFMHDQLLFVDPHVIRKSQRAINTLFRDYPKALPKVVGDSALWYDTHIRYLEHVKSLLKLQHDAPESLFEHDSDYQNTCRKIWPAGTRDDHLLQVISWKFYTNRTHLKKAKQFLERYEHLVGDLPMTECMDLMALYVLEPEKSQPLIKWLTNPHLFEELCHYKEPFFSPYLKHKTEKDVLNARRNFSPNHIPKPDNQAVINQFLRELSKLKPVQLRRSLLIFNETHIPESMLSWHSWWEQAHVCRQKITNHITYPGEVNINEIQDLQRQLNHLKSNRPDDIRLNEVCSVMLRLAHKKAIVQPLIQALKSTQLTQFTCMSPHEMLLYWARLYEECTPRDPLFIAYLNGMSDFLLADTPRLKKLPWRKPPKYIWNAPDTDVFRLNSTETIKHYFSALLTIIQAEQVAVNSIRQSLVISLVHAGLSTRQITTVYSILANHEYEYQFPDTVADIVRYFDLTDDEINEFLSIYARSTNSWKFAHGMRVLMQAQNSEEQLQFYKDMLFNREVTQLLEASRYVEVIINHAGQAVLPQPPCQQTGDANWMNDYPAIFHSSIQRLNAVSTEAKTQVFQLFKKNWWTQSMLQAEIKKLQEHLRTSAESEGGKISSRIQKLEHKLKNHQGISEHKTQKILIKLDQFHRQNLSSQWLDALKQRFTLCWADLFQLDLKALPDWLTGQSMIQKLTPILNFHKSDKSLAIKVIQERLQGPYYYLKNHSKNKQFLQKFKSTDIDLSKWPDGYGNHQYTAKNGHQITLQVEADPLALLDMGGHFGTCLSPGNFNYFSVFPNIADVNKAVIYARNEHHKVVGRVLMGITKQGGLQVFHRYAHHADYEFDQHVLQFIDLIIAQTGLTLTHRGAVQPLCGSDWYDDGATEFSRSFPYFQDGSDFRSGIKDFSAEEFEQALSAQLSPDKPDSLMFTNLMSVPELTLNTDIYPALLKLSIKIKNVTNYDLLQLYELATNQQHRTTCYEIHRKALFSYFIKQVTDYHHVHYDVVEQLAEHHPSDALRIIKKHAKVEKQHWQDNPLYGAAQATAVALEQLARDQQARAIRETAQHQSRLKR